ncbi:hypothetical protein EMPG_15618 [Blastomyces silverae]|uniref:Uncharacterized protein n=1 Tax=Blastomyces silverae TaxID=2060906 RepID=A0A0H1BCW6_9EURO|nr:hypothetical protein EMPG_15618 [Blastomyces silverae]
MSTPCNHTSARRRRGRRRNSMTRSPPLPSRARRATPLWRRMRASRISARRR